MFELMPPIFTDYERNPSNECPQWLKGNTRRLCFRLTDFILVNFIHGPSILIFLVQKDTLKDVVLLRFVCLFELILEI